MTGDLFDGVDKDLVVAFQRSGNDPYQRNHGDDQHQQKAKINQQFLKNGFALDHAGFPPFPSDPAGSEPKGTQLFPKNTIQFDFHDGEKTFSKLCIDVEIGLGKKYD